MRKFRIKEKRFIHWNGEGEICFTPLYNVQIKVLWWWKTIKKFIDFDDYHKAKKDAKRFVEILER